MASAFEIYESQYPSAPRAKQISFNPPLPTSRQHKATVAAALPSSTHLPSQHSSSHQPRKGSATSTFNTPATSAATSRSTTSTSTHSHSHSQTQPSSSVSIREAVQRASAVNPSSDVAEWAHQTHTVQGRSYWWCQGCFPKEIVAPLELPRALGPARTEDPSAAERGRRRKVVRIQNEPSHCYDI